MKSKLIAAVCGMFLAGAVASSHAGQIQFDTTGSPIVLSNGITVTYVGYPGVLDNTYGTDPSDADYAPSPISVDYGTFSATGLSTDTGSVSSPYTLNLTIELPTPSGPHQINGSVSGYFYVNGTTGNVDTLQFVPSGTLNATYGGYEGYSQTFDTDGIGTVTWYFDATNIGSSGPGPAYTGDMLGTVTYTPYTVPTPASAMGGAALIGLVGLVNKVRKNRQSM